MSNVLLADDVPTVQLPARSVAPMAAWLRLAIAAAILLGVFFRFYNVDYKVFWGDEIFTALHVLGLTEAEVVARAPEMTSTGELRAVLHPGRSNARTVGDTVRSLVIEDPHHAPLYYVLAHGWVKLAGDSVRSLRLLSVVFGILALPCMYWLCWELFGQSSAGWIGTALLAVAPVSVLYSQEAREYALWTIAILLMSAAFLVAARTGTVVAWAGYALALTFALYVYPISAAVAFGFLTLLAVPTIFRAGRTRFAAVAATLVGFALFTPWIAVMVHGRDQIDKSMNTVIEYKHSAIFILRAYLSLFRTDLVDLNLIHRELLNLALLIPALALFGYALFTMLRSDDVRVKAFIGSIIVTSSLPFVLPDLLGTGNRTTNPRYFTPFFIALDLCLVALFLNKLGASNGRRAVGIGWQVLFVGVIALRALSCTESARADTWWSKFNERAIQVADAVNSGHRPLLVGDGYIEYPLTLSGYLRDDVALLYRPVCYQCSLPPAAPPDVTAVLQPHAARDVFLLGPSAHLQAQVRTELDRIHFAGSYHCINIRDNCQSELHLW